ncbi:MAG: fumarylacetoacetate hydrolase family protein [Thaumarchaeota archaeon]|nr:MAG: fumarylacetoacetate hydrolase family protein [Nitrososphaerota archaeon]
MKLLTFSHRGEEHVGFLRDGIVFDLTEARASLGRLADYTLNMLALLQGGGRVLKELKRRDRSLLSEGETKPFLRQLRRVKLLAPVPRPGKIICAGINYRSHIKEAGASPVEPYFFFKPATAVVGSGADVVIPSFSKKPDHEVELAVVIGMRGRDIPATRAYDHIVGYTVVNDISLRDGSERGVTGTDLGRNWYKGKAADTSCPMGPFIVTKDEIPNPYPLALKLRVNGETRQDGTTDDMIFKIPDLVASASEGVTLECGDVISTGTCSGVGLSTGKYLEEGDLVEAEVERVGVLVNRIRAMP